MKWKTVSFCIQIKISFPQVGAQGVQDDCGISPGEIQGCFDVLSFTSEFELNAIPSAVVSIAIGRQADDVERAAAIHYYINDLQLQLPAQVWCQATSMAYVDATYENIDLWPACPFIIFDGYITGSGYRRGQGGAELSLALTHWLTDLNFSSALSKQSHPLNPSQLYFSAQYVLTEGYSGGSFLNGVGPFATGPGLGMQFFINPAWLQTDFWGGQGYVGSQYVNSGLKSWFLYLTQTNRLNEFQIRNSATGSAITYEAFKNWEACRALSRFEPYSTIDGDDFYYDDGYTLGVPLGMDDLYGIGSNIVSGIGTAIGKETLDAYTAVTIWDRLAGDMHSTYMFSIVPLVEKALVVPDMPCMQGQYEIDSLIHRTIRTSNYESLDLSSTMPRPLRAVGVTVDKNMADGGGVSIGTPIPYLGIAGYYDKMAISTDARYREGMVLFKQAPTWLSNIIGQGWLYAQASVGANGVPINTALARAGAADSGLGQAQVAYGLGSIADNLAKTLYIREALKGRQGVLKGPVRFDIAPGSNIKVEATLDPFVQEIVYPYDEHNHPSLCDPYYYQYYYCQVIRVSTVIDCQNMNASTSFFLSHVMTEKEFQDPSLTVNYHPLWTRCTWGGCVMVEDPAFNPQTTRSESC